MAVKLGTTAIKLPFIKALIGETLIYQKSGEIKHTDNPIPTTWIYVNDTEYYNGGYRITASTTYSASYPLNGAFDNNTSTWWRSQNLTSQHWVILELPEAIRVTKFNLNSVDNQSKTYLSAIIQGSNDNSVWDDLGTYTEPEEAALIEVSLNSTGYYKYYRLLYEIRSSKYVAGIYEWQISEYYTKHAEETETITLINKEG